MDCLCGFAGGFKDLDDLLDHDHGSAHLLSVQRTTHTHRCIQIHTDIHTQKHTDTHT